MFRFVALLVGAVLFTCACNLDNQALNVSDNLACPLTPVNEIATLPRRISSAPQMDKNGVIWVASGSALHKYDTSGIWVEFPGIRYDWKSESYTKIPGGLSDDVTQEWDGTEKLIDFFVDLAIDDKGNVWLGSYWSGIHQFDVASEKFVSNPDYLTKRARIATNLKWDEHGKAVWGTSGEIWSYLPEPGWFQVNWNHIKIEASHYSYPSEIQLGKNGEIWFAGWSGLLGRLVPTTNLLGQMTYKSELIQRESKVQSLQALLVDQNGALWLGGANEPVEMYDPNTGVSESYEIPQSVPRNYTSLIVQSMAFDKNGNIWFGIADSSTVAVLNPKTKTWRIASPLNCSSIMPKESWEISTGVHLSSDKAGNVLVMAVQGGRTRVYHFAALPAQWSK